MSSPGSAHCFWCLQHRGMRGLGCSCFPEVLVACGEFSVLGRLSCVGPLLGRVRWYVFVEGNEVDLHNAHWHGNVLLRDGHHVDQCATRKHGPVQHLA